jgi:MFS family permease
LLLCAAAAGALLSVVLVDRIGRLPLLRISSLVAATLCAVLVAVAQQYAHKLDITSDENIPVPNNWPIVQLAALATLSVSIPACLFARYVGLEAQPLMHRSACLH